MQIAIVIPTYNERSNVVKLLPQIKEATGDFDHFKEANSASHAKNVHIVVVDDNSSDGTADAVLSISQTDDSIHLIKRPGKMGLGSAYRDAFKWISENLDAKIVIQMDADLSHPPSLLTGMIQMVANGSADVAVASRYLDRGGTENWPMHRKIISKGANFFAKLFLGMNVKDITSGYRAYSISCVRDLLANNLSSSGYEYQIEVLYILSQLQKKIVEIPFIFANRANGKSKLSLRDMLHFATEVIDLRLHPKIKESERSNDMAKVPAS